MPDPMRVLLDELADLRRRVRALETAPRAPFTSVAGGITTWLRDDGAESVAIGTDEDGDSFIRVQNGDGTAPVFEVDSGSGAFPLAASAWQREATMGSAADGWSSISNVQSAGSFYVMWAATLALTTDQVGIYFRYRTTGTAVGTIRLNCTPLNTREGHTPNALTVAKSWAGLSGDGAVGFSGLGIGLGVSEVVTVPTSIWTPAADPAGTLAVFRLEVAVTSGTGNVQMVPIEPLYCSVP